MSLPTFKYHPDPLATGSVIESNVECVCCGQARGLHLYRPGLRDRRVRRVHLSLVHLQRFRARETGSDFHR